MGSLMGGWDSPVYDPTTVKYQRNKSATKEEIEAYWRSKKKDEEERPKAISDTLMKSDEESILKEPEGKIQRSNSVPLSSATDGLLDTGTETSLEKLVTKTGWYISPSVDIVLCNIAHILWTRCTSGFLNEPREGTGGWLSAIQVQNFPDLRDAGRKQPQWASLDVQMYEILDDKAKGQSEANRRTSCLVKCKMGKTRGYMENECDFVAF
ncbi:hypothetical protein C3L33_11064, partial [Rhododendron williamsianum]